ncbi:MAG: hypothetical protein AAGK22_08755 [Acidobacteriota bacterium]
MSGNTFGSSVRRLTLTLAIVGGSPLAAQVDLSGTYDVGTLTPLERAEVHGENLYLTADEAAEIEAQAAAFVARRSEASDPSRDAPEAGGRIGGYNMFWIDRGETATSVDGRFRTSILSRPANGRRPPMTPEGAARLEGLLDAWRIVWRNPDPTTTRNDGTAWWLELEGPGPYDNLEQRPMAERCLFGSRSTAGPPMLPNIYNNHKTIVQTETHVMILTEMNHDARVVHLAPEEPKGTVPALLGTSFGRWEGDTLVVTTRGFKDIPPLSGASENLEVVEWLSRREDGGLDYRFEVSDPTVWTESWGGEYGWRPSDGKVYEYACHEGNYALGNVMRGARALEREAAGNRTGE